MFLVQWVQTHATDILAVLFVLTMFANLVAVLGERFGSPKVARLGHSVSTSFVEFARAIRDLIGPKDPPSKGPSAGAPDERIKVITKAPSGLQRLAVFGVLIGPVFLGGCSSFTPAQNATLGAQVPKLAGAGCAIADAFGAGQYVRFLCKVLESGTGDGALSNMSTGPDVVARPARYTTVEVLVPREQAEAFAAANGAQ